MLGRWLWDFVTGYVTIRCYGTQIPVLINTAIQNHIHIWNIKRLADGSIQFTTLRKNISLLRKLARPTRTKFRFGHRVGVPFFIGQVVSRKMFLLGVCVFSLGMYLLSSMIWSVEIEGVKKISPESVLAVAASVGIHKWQWKPNLPDTDVLQAKMLDKMPEMSFIGVSIHGTHVHIQVAEKTPPTQPALNVPQNIIAAKKGTIIDVLAVKGNKKVQRNQVVQKGDVLISGSIGEDGKTLVPARGEVFAEVWYPSIVNQPLKVTHEVLTGAKITKDFVVLGNKAIQVWGYGQSPFSHSVPNEHDYKWSWQRFSLPVTVRRVDYFEAKQVDVELTAAQAKQMALERASSDAVAQAGKNAVVIGQRFLKEPDVRDGALHAEILTLVKEQIGIAQPLAGSASPETGQNKTAP